MTTPDALLECRNVIAGYKRPVVRDVSFVLNKGEVLGIRGQNGVGKSTLLSAISGAARIFEGAVLRSPDTELLHHRQHWEVGAEFPMTGLDVCDLTGARAADAPARLASLLPKRLDQLSGGQGQMVRLWSCLGSAAGLLLLDEPTNSLDTSAIEELVTMIRASSANRAMVVVSHESAFLDSVCSRSFTLEPL